MALYYVHTGTDNQGDHEVHRTGCSHMPNPENRESLGNHDNCRTAVAEARRRGYRRANGCWFCSRDCHTS